MRVFLCFVDLQTVLVKVYRRGACWTEEYGGQACVMGEYGTKVSLLETYEMVEYGMAAYGMTAYGMGNGMAGCAGQGCAGQGCGDQYLPPKR